ncbi:MAG TPA: type I restriction endonuclease subunit R, partial [Melioribacteraceae bacterium]|nr:type I restriction endonuclease subunit R [Melioribacteraceae bacterium]
KRTGIELKEAFNQIDRYRKHSFWAAYGLFYYAQLFVISNNINTKYFANAKELNFLQTFYWTDKNNNRITKLDEFANIFLEPCFISKIIAQYIVLNESRKTLMVLRPYQYYAVESIVERVKNSRKNGYIWHTTGSGKTLTSFKVSNLLINIPKIDRVVFVVDRKDLDSQTIQEFESFSKGSVDQTDNTKMLVEQFNNNTRLIVTTIQKLNNALSKGFFAGKMDKHKEEQVVFIFDECHRSQFGETHKRIKNFFKNARLFGFTGTPIFAENAAKKGGIEKTTADLFGECLHKYVIVDAIRDENVLRFSVEYLGKFKEKENLVKIKDEQVYDIDTKELLESEDRMEKIVDYIINNHNHKTHSGKFNAIFCVGGVKNLIKYYDLFKKKKEQGLHNLRIATIFSYTDNEDNTDDDGLVNNDNNNSQDLFGYIKDNHSRTKLEEFIEDYNKQFGTKYTTKDSNSFYEYYAQISKKVKEKQIDLLLVVNMFLTGFDAVTLNTLYVDKNLKYHGLIQAFSRTNRIYNAAKSHGNIVCFRYLKNETDDAITLFSNKNAKEYVLLKPYNNYVNLFNKHLEELKIITPNYSDFDKLEDENDIFKFIVCFRNLLRNYNTLITFSEFNWDDLNITEQEFSNYKTKYLDANTFKKKVKTSVLNEVDFELELIQSDEINVSYIIGLLVKYYNLNNEEKEKGLERVKDLIDSEPTLRSKRELIKKFIENYVMGNNNLDDLEALFVRFCNEEEMLAFNNICADENINPIKFNTLIEEYNFTGNMPITDDLIKVLNYTPSFFERKPTAERIKQKLIDYLSTYVN